jgi:NADPH2:quinone reductase
MPTTARVARIHEYGPPEVLRFEDIVVGEPGDDEALIRNTVIGLNFVDSRRAGDGSGQYADDRV